MGVSSFKAVDTPIFGDKTLLVCVDIQERLMTVMAEKERVRKNATKIISAGRELALPILVSEQYPKGLGKTDLDVAGLDILEKSSFSIFGSTDMVDYIQKAGYNTLAFFGIESHVCVLQSVIHALAFGYNVIVLADSCSSRDLLCHNIAIQNMSQRGAHIIPSESFIFGAMMGCKDSHFKAISAIVK